MFPIASTDCSGTPFASSSACRLIRRLRRPLCMKRKANPCASATIASTSKMRKNILRGTNRILIQFNSILIKNEPHQDSVLSGLVSARGTLARRLKLCPGANFASLFTHGTHSAVLSSVAEPRNSLTATSLRHRLRSVRSHRHSADKEQDQDKDDVNERFGAHCKRHTGIDFYKF
jgi:hypothetical protein